MYYETKDIPIFFEDKEEISHFTRKMVPGKGRVAPSSRIFPESPERPLVTVLNPEAEGSPHAAEVLRDVRREIIRAGLDLDVGFIKSGGPSPYGNLLGIPSLGLYYAGFKPKDVTHIVAETFQRGNIIAPLALMSHTKATDSRFLFDPKSGFIAAIDESQCMVRVARYFADWEEDVSCGKCTPCRVGSGLLRESLARLTEGRAGEEELEKIKELLDMLVETMSTSTYCRFGITTSAPIASALKYFAEEFEAHAGGKCPAGACKPLVSLEAAKG